MNRVDWRQVGRDLVPLAPIVAVCVVLALNITLHHKTYAPPEAPIYIAPLITDAPAAPVTQPTAVTTSTTAPRAVVIWDPLADCESGRWDRYGVPIPGSRDWASTSDNYEGGVHFTSSTWTNNKPAGYPAHAYQATRAQQIVVAEIVLEHQGPNAWPTCSRKVGLR